MSEKELSKETMEGLQSQINIMRNEINRLLSNIIRLDVRITQEIEVTKITFSDIDILKKAHSLDSEHSVLKH